MACACIAADDSEALMLPSIVGMVSQNGRFSTRQTAPMFGALPIISIWSTSTSVMSMVLLLCRMYRTAVVVSPITLTLRASRCV